MNGVGILYDNDDGYYYGGDHMAIGFDFVCITTKEYHGYNRLGVVAVSRNA